MKYTISDCLYFVESDSTIFGKKIYNLDASLFSELNPSEYSNLLKFIDENSKLLKVDLIGVRVPQSNLDLTFQLENFGYKFIETNYQPYISVSDIKNVDHRQFSFVEAKNDTLIEISDEVLCMFEYGRYHQDVHACNDLASLRYKKWLLNTATNTNQVTYVAYDLHGKVIAFFVIDNSISDVAHLSLVGVMKNYRGKGLAKTIWCELFSFLRSLDYKVISTSISSHNIPIFNMYASLGFRFLEPKVTFHKWFFNR